jgi:hypothetical protein
MPQLSNPTPLETLDSTRIAVFVYLRPKRAHCPRPELLADALERARAISISIPRLLSAVAAADVVLLPPTPQPRASAPPLPELAVLPTPA